MCKLVGQQAFGIKDCKSSHWVFRVNDDQYNSTRLVGRGYGIVSTLISLSTMLHLVHLAETVTPQSQMVEPVPLSALSQAPVRTRRRLDRSKCVEPLFGVWSEMRGMGSA